MAVTNPSIGARIIRTIGRRGFRPDENPARISGAVFSDTLPNGRTVLKVPVVEVAKNLAGEEYLREAVASIFFAFDRSELHPMLDGTREQPKSMAQVMTDLATQSLERLRALPEAGSIEVDSLDI